MAFQLVQILYWLALATWFGPGFYGSRTACGPVLTTTLVGVAHRTLPCGTKVTIRYNGRTAQAVVRDRGPYVGGREFDLAGAVARKLGFNGVGRIYVATGR